MENIRPTFLTVLCILTFIGSAWGIYQGISNYVSAEQVAGVTGEAFEKVQEDLGDQEGADMASKMLSAMSESTTPEKIKNSGIASALTSILTLLGAVLMWGLNKKGFYVYLIGTVAGVIAPIVIYGGIMGAIAGGATAFAGILFCILYALNLKHMR